MKRSENFSEWYSDVIERAGVSDKRYPVKGMSVWMPYGWSIMKNIDDTIRRHCDATGHGEVCFPLLIPASEFDKEAEHIKGFGDQVYWVTRAGQNELDVPLLLRPTSETAMYPMFALWIRSHADLPLRVYQIVNTFRYETKQTRPFIRVREIHFFEAHTCHATEEEAEEQVRTDLEIMRGISDVLCLPWLVHLRPEWDKFAGAHYSLAIDAFMGSGRALQVASMHHYRTNFSKAYGIRYEDENGEHRYVHQTTYGISERILGAVVGVHGDDKGLVLPPGIAPIQVVIVPIFDRTSYESVIAACRGMLDLLRGAGIRVHLDERDATPGSKFYHWELRGVPLRVEIGMRDLSRGVVTLARRDTGVRSEVPEGEVITRVKTTLSEIKRSLMERARSALDSAVRVVDSLDECGKDRIFRTGWCGDVSCAGSMEERTGMSILGVPQGEGVKGPGRCAACGGGTKDIVDLAKTY